MRATEQGRDPVKIERNVLAGQESCVGLSLSEGCCLPRSGAVWLCGGCWPG
jgi:hypothetical protein